MWVWPILLYLFIKSQLHSNNPGLKHLKAVFSKCVEQWFYRMLIDVTLREFCDRSVIERMRDKSFLLVCVKDEVRVDAVVHG